MSETVTYDEKGSVSVEFSLLVIPFFLMVFTILFIVYHSLVQAELDRATVSIAKELALTATDAPDAIEFLTPAACNKHIGSLLDCSRVLLGAAKVTGRLYDYRNKVIGGKQWSLGCAGDTVIVELDYPVASFFTPLVIADVVQVSGVDHYRGRAVIRREPVITGPGAC